MITCKQTSILIFSALLSLSELSANAPSKREGSLSPIDLRCEYLTTPLGIDRARPRFQWRLKDASANSLQTAYQITIGRDSAALAKGKGALWQETLSSSLTQATYAGKPLAPRTKYYWSVSVWDKDKQQSRPVISWFETGQQGNANWQGHFISDGQDRESRQTPYFRKQVHIGKELQSARAYIVAAGLYELEINGEKAGDHFLDPAFTNYDKRLLYTTYDVTDQFKQGENVIGVILGNGWYNHQPMAEWWFERAPWRDRPAFCLNVYLTYKDGTQEVIRSDRSFKVKGGPITFNAIYVAENYDFNRELKGWGDPAYDDSDWGNATEVKPKQTPIVSQAMHPIRLTESRTPAHLTRLSDTLYLYDFGQNWAGITQFNVTGPKGTRVTLRHGEQLDSRHKRIFDANNTQFYQNVKEPLKYGVHPKDELFQTDVLWLDGGANTFRPRFNYKGFQYVEVASDQPLRLDESCLTSYFAHTDVPHAGTFACSDTLINRLWRATNYSYLSNLMGYPTDCPHREKNGWTGDAHLAIETGLFNYDGITLYEKWMADHRDDLHDGGKLHCIIPSGGWGMGELLDWTCSMTIIPWTLYTFYGDKAILADNYQAMKAHTDNWIDQLPEGLVTDKCLGDWVPHKSVADKGLTASIYHFKNADIVAKTAQILGKNEEARYYRQQAERIKKAINDKYLDPETGIYAHGYQTELSMPLYWGIVPPECKDKVAEQLSRRVAADDDHLDVGIMGCKTILGALTATGHVDQAYRMVTQQDYPSWGNWLRQGATTLFENWDYNGLAKGYSQNHIMYGELGAWFYKALLGINPDPDQPGFQHFFLTPHFIPELEYAQGSYLSPYGEITVSWKRADGQIHYEVTVPAGSSATLLLDDEQIHLGSGSHAFNCPAQGTPSLAKLQVEQLRCELLESPLAIDNTSPHFSWKLRADQPCGGSSAYQIQVASSREGLAKGEADLWDSGQIRSEACTGVAYEGAPLSAQQLAYWRVCVWDREGNRSEWSEPALFGIGLLRPEDWSPSTRFIGMPDNDQSSPLLRKRFTCAPQGERYLLHVNSLGYHEVYINGKAISEAVLTPAVSQFNKRSQIVTYDVSSFLKEGDNDIVLWLGNGWYRADLPGVVAGGPYVRAELHAISQDGNTLICETDHTWQVRPSGYASFGNWHPWQFGGEIVDARLLPPDFTHETLDATDWQSAKEITIPLHAATPQMCELNYTYHTLHPVNTYLDKDGHWIYDMGTNFVGLTEIRLPKVGAGEQITLHYCDFLDGDTLFRNNVYTDRYIGNGEAGCFSSKFNYKGYRYLKIEGVNQALAWDAIIGKSVRTGYSGNASFACSDTELNAIHDMVHRTLEALTLGGYMVDCPQIERLGYGGDGNASTPALQTLFNVAPLYMNWLQAWADCMRGNGSMPHTAPNPYAAGGGPYWCGFLITASWQTYVNYGDKRPLERFYPHMKQWLRYAESFQSEGLLRKWNDTEYRNWYLGDWATPEGINQTDSLSINLINNCFLSTCYQTMAKIAEVLQKEEDQPLYREKASVLNRTIQRHFYQAQRHSYSTGTQIDLIYPLLAGVTPDSLIPAVKQTLFEETKTRFKGHLATGLVGIPVITEWAIREGEADFMYQMLKQHGYPGYLYMLDHGATTTWEHWNGERSHIHNCYNGIGRWFYQALGGICPDETQAGYKHFTIQPQMVNGLTWVEVTKDTPYGPVQMRWDRKNEQITFKVEIPVGSTASFIPPANAKSAHPLLLQAGSHYLEYHLQ